MTEKLDGYSAEIPLRITATPDSDAAEEQYERVRRALQRYEDALDPPLRVELTRLGPHLLPEPALEEALSTCREAMVDVLGVAADHPDVVWSYRQQQSETEGVRVEVRRRGFSSQD